MSQPPADPRAPVDHPSLDPRTPVVVGVGQASERLGEPGYRQRSPVDLAADAAADALADTGADPAAVAAAIDIVVGIRQFENSHPRARAPLGRSDNYPRSVAGRIGASPARAVLEVSGGQAPQHLVNEFAAVIARGGSEVTLIFGSEAISTVEHFARAQDRPDFTEHADGSLEDRGYGLAGMMSRHQAAHGLTGAPSQYALIDNARRARLGLTREEYAAAMGALFAPFTRVAAANPHAAAPVERSAGGTGHADRGEPAHRRPLHPLHRGAGKGQSGCRRAAHVGGRGARARRPRRPLGVPARPRRPARTGPA